MIRLQLISLEGTKYDDDVYEVLVPTLDGQIGVLPGHMPLISVATSGIVSVRKNAQDIDAAMEHVVIGGGVVEIENNVLRVLVDQAELAEDINEAEAQAAHDRALRMKAQAKDEVSLEQAQALVDRTATRLQVAGLKRRHPHK